MGFLDDLNPFKRDDPKVRLLRTPEAEAATKELLGIARRPFDRSTPTAPVAGLSPMEIQADELASQYGGSTPEGLDYLRSLIGKGSFMDDPEYQALFKEVREAGQEETNRVGRSLQQRGGATSSTGRDILGRSVEDMESNLLATSLPYMQQDRSQRIGAANLLSTLGENAMLRRLDALSTRGALQRNLEQLRQQADYERRRKELGHPTEVQAPWYATVAGLPVDWSVTQDPSMFEQISPLLGAAAQVYMGQSLLKGLGRGAQSVYPAH